MWKSSRPLQKLRLILAPSLILFFWEQEIRSMMGERGMMQEALFYGFSLERHVPDRHLLRRIDRFVDLAVLRARLGPLQRRRSSSTKSTFSSHCGMVGK
jgi:hypothetical protein